MSHRAITPREPILATAEELTAVGVHFRSEDLFTGRSSSGRQPPIHFGLARLVAPALDYWRSYRSSAGHVADVMARLAHELRKPDDQLDLDELAEAHGWSRDELERVAATIRGRGYRERNIFRSVKGGVIGFEYLLDEDFARTEDRFVAYAAREPLAETLESLPPDAAAGPAAQLRHHAATYSDVLLAVGVATERGLPTVTHFGIFRNPLAFLDAEPAHRGLAMKLHGFAATVARHALSAKHFMVTEPMPEMTRILRETVSAGDLLEGENDADLREQINRHLPAAVPPIGDGRRFNWAGFTLRARPTAIRLETLASHYDPS